MNDKKRRPLFWGRLRLQYVIVLLAKPLKQKDLIVKRCREIPGEKLQFGHRTSTPGPQTLPTAMQLTCVIDLSPVFHAGCLLMRYRAPPPKRIAMIDPPVVNPSLTMWILPSK